MIVMSSKSMNVARHKASNFHRSGRMAPPRLLRIQESIFGPTRNGIRHLPHIPTYFIAPTGPWRLGDVRWDASVGIWLTAAEMPTARATLAAELQERDDPDVQL